MIDIVTITNDGVYLSSGDSITLTGGGQSAIIQVDNVGRRWYKNRIIN